MVLDLKTIVRMRRYTLYEIIMTRISQLSDNEMIIHPGPGIGTTEVDSLIRTYL